MLLGQVLSVDNNPTIQPATAPNTRFVLADIMQASFLTMLREQQRQLLVEYRGTTKRTGRAGHGHLTPHGEIKLWRARNSGHVNVASLLEILAVVGCKKLVLTGDMFP